MVFCLNGDLNLEKLCAFETWSIIIRLIGKETRTLVHFRSSVNIMKFMLMILSQLLP